MMRGSGASLNSFQLIGAAMDRVARTALEEWRCSVFYRRFVLRGDAPDALAARPRDLRMGDPARGEEMVAGDFRLAGQVLELEPGESPWRRPSPSRRFAKRLHQFEWLRHLSALDTGEAAETAGALLDEWAEVFGEGNMFSWAPEVSGHRLSNWLAGAKLLFDDPDPAVRARRAAILSEQAEHVARSAGEAEAGRERFAARAAAALAAICLDWPLERRTRLLDDLAKEAAAQILSDGGHVSRSPEAALESLLDLALVEDALDQRGLETPAQIRRVIGRLVPAIRFFRHGDGGLAAFNGGGEGEPETVENALARDEAVTPVFSTAPASVFLRAEAGKSLLIYDGGGCPPGAHTPEAHAGALSFEFSHGAQRLIVNCGWSANQPASWRAPVRSTAAHSALVVEETSSARLARGKLARSLLGGRFAAGANSLESRMRAEEQGRWMEAAHDGYRKAFGIVHRRRLYLSASGDDLRGEDLLFRPADESEPPPGGAINFAIRFHLYPGLRVSLSRDQASALIAPEGGGPGWRLRTDRGPLHLEPSAYLAAGAPPRRSSQLVIYGAAKAGAGPDENDNRVRWALQLAAADKT